MDQIKQRIEFLREELNKHNYDYYVLSMPTISDFEFDEKLKELSDLGINIRCFLWEIHIRKKR